MSSVRPHLCESAWILSHIANGTILRGRVAGLWGWWATGPQAKVLM